MQGLPIREEAPCLTKLELERRKLPPIVIDNPNNLAWRQQGGTPSETWPLDWLHPICPFNLLQPAPSNHSSKSPTRV